MRVYGIFLTFMTVLFALSTALLLALTVTEAFGRRREKVVLYLALAALAGIVAAGFYFFRWLI